MRTFYSPVDDVHGVLAALLSSTQKSLVLNMYGYDDDELNDIILAKLADEHRGITSGAISHMKIVIIDGVYMVRGSPNWSLAGEQKQDNELTIHNNAVIAAETRAELDRNHDAMLKQMAAQRTHAAPTA